ncbi:MAG: ribonuclease R family protein [Pseudomonadales bacterium]
MKPPRGQDRRQGSTEKGKDRVIRSRPDRLMQAICKLLTSENSGLTRRQIAGRLSLTTQDKQALDDAIEHLILDSQVVEGAGRRYRLAEFRAASGLISGRIFSHPDGFGFVQVEKGEDVFLSPYQMRGVYHGDQVRVVLRPGRSGRSEGVIDEVTARAFDRLLVRLTREGRSWLGEPLAKNLFHPVRIVDSGGIHMEKGRTVEVAVLSYPSHREAATGRVLQEGSGDRLQDQIRAIAEAEGISLAFPPEVEKAAESLGASPEANQDPKRRNLERLAFVTIDGEDAKDFDDAVFAKRTKQGYTLYVAIADVAHYVKPDSLIDMEARSRGTSIYFPGTVLPMLPEALSNELCSLKPDVPRLAMVCELTFDDAGERTGYTFYEAQIRSKARLIYEDVAEHLEQGSEIHAPAAARKSLQALQALAERLLIARAKRGALEIEVAETRMFLDASGEPIDQRLNQRTLAHRMIEEFMLAANIATADHLESSKIGGLYRVHAAPTLERVEGLNELLRWFRLPEVAVSDPMRTNGFQGLLDQLSGSDDAPLLVPFVLRAMQQAVYSAVPEPHFGLAYDRYAHFTSPIRRLPDLINHRLVKATLQSNSAAKAAKPAPRRPFSDEVLVTLAKVASETERRADKASQDVNQFLRCQYLGTRLGEEFLGRVSQVSKLGAFVLLDQPVAEGLIPFREIRNQIGRLSLLPHALVSDATGERLAMGDRVAVQLTRVDEKLGHVEFALISRQSSRHRRRGSPALESKTYPTEIPSEETVSKPSKPSSGSRSNKPSKKKNARSLARYARRRRGMDVPSAGTEGELRGQREEMGLGEASKASPDASPKRAAKPKRKRVNQAKALQARRAKAPATTNKSVSDEPLRKNKGSTPRTRPHKRRPKS